MKRIYISGPITGQDDYMEKFERAEATLRPNKEWEIINPAKIMEHMPESTKHHEFMKISLDLLNMCDAVIMLKGWKESDGARTEFEYAVEHDISIFFEGGGKCHDH